MQLSVIILNYNVCAFLEQCVRSVQAAIAGIEAEIIVVDNNSPDNSVAMMRSKFSDVQLIANKDNVGFAKANNQAAAIAKGKYLCILNPDTVVSEKVFENLIAFETKQENCGIIGTKLIDGTGNFLPESKRGIPTPKLALSKFLGLHKLSETKFGGYYAPQIEENKIGQVPILVGAFMFLKRSIYNEVGGFDEQYFMYGEDIDLSYSVLRLGYANYYASLGSVIHYKGESTAKDTVYLNRFRKAMNLFYKKHFSASWILNVMLAIGSYFFSFLKLFKLKTSESKRTGVSKYTLISASSAKQHRLQEHLKQQVERIGSFNELSAYISQNESFKGQCLIFDGESFANNEIIQAFERYKNKGLTYRIWPKDCNFILGSDDSDSRGEVIMF